MSDPAIGREIGSYQIVDVLGQGGMGKVYRAQHPYIGKQVAVKFLKAELAANPDSVQRFFQEARAVNDIHHENVIDVLDFGRTNDGEYFIIMELLLGKTLGDSIKSDAPFQPKRIGHTGLQICSALAAAHENGIIHRDLKPDNIFLVTRAGQKDFIKVLDFGLAKLVDGSAGTNTTTGMVMGTPLYMAPEQALGQTLDAQTDVYALGVILYQMATGTVPFFDNNPVALATMHVTKPPPKPSERYPNIDPKLEKLILKCLAKEKKDRYLSMTAVALDLAMAFNLDTTIYFGRDLKDGSVGEGDEMPTALDADRTVITSAPQSSSHAPQSAKTDQSTTSPPPMELVTRANNEVSPSVHETSNLRAEITGKSISTKGGRGLVIGAVFALLLGLAAYITFVGPSKNTTAAPSKQPAAPQVKEGDLSKLASPPLSQAATAPIPATQPAPAIENGQTNPQDPKNKKNNKNNKTPQNGTVTTPPTNTTENPKPANDPTLTPEIKTNGKANGKIGDGTAGFDSLPPKR